MSAEGLIRYNAQRCETAKGKVCVCRCGGELHGHAHSEPWIKKQAAIIDAAKADLGPVQGALELGVKQNSFENPPAP